MSEVGKREKYWLFLVSFANKHFSLSAQEFMYQSCFSYTNLVVKLEALGVLYSLFSQRVFDCQLLFAKKHYYASFINFASEPDEDLRIIGFKFIVLAYLHCLKGSFVFSFSSSFKIIWIWPFHKNFFIFKIDVSANDLLLFGNYGMDYP